MNRNLVYAVLVLLIAFNITGAAFLVLAIREAYRYFAGHGSSAMAFAAYRAIGWKLIAIGSVGIVPLIRRLTGAHAERWIRRWIDCRERKRPLD